MPTGALDLDALLKGAKDSLARADALSATLPPAPALPRPLPAPIGLGPFPGADAPPPSLWERIKNVAGYSPLPTDIGEQFANDVDPAADRDARALSGQYGAWDRIKSFLAGTGGGFLSEMRRTSTPAGLAELGSLGEAIRGARGLLPFSRLAGAFQAGQGIETAADPTKSTSDRVLGGAQAALGALVGLGPSMHAAEDAPVFEPNPNWDRTVAANRQTWRRTVGATPDESPLPHVQVDPIAPRGLPEPQAQIGTSPIPMEPSPLADTSAAAPAATVAEPAADVPAAASPLAKLFRVHIPAEDAAANLRDFGSVMGPAHASDELAAMEREQGPLSDEFKRAFLSRRQGMHLDERRMDNEWRGLVAEFKDQMGRGPTIAPAADAPPPQSLAELLRASVDDSVGRAPATKILADVESGRVPKVHDVPDDVYEDLRNKLGGTSEPVGGPRSSAPNIAAEPQTTVAPEDLHRYLNERGEIDPRLALQLGLHVTGAVGGAAAGHAIGRDSGHATRDTVLGALLGGIAPALLSPEGRNALLRLRASGMVSGPMTLAKKIAGDTGAVGAEALEGSIGKGDPSYGLHLLKQFLSGETLDVAKRSFQDAGDSEGLASEYLNSPVVKTGPLAIPGRLLGAATDATQDAFQRGGLGPKQAQDLTYLGTPKTALGQWLVSRPQEARWVLPMVRVATNLAEKGAARTPLGALYRLLNTPNRSPELTRRILTQGTVGAGTMAAGAALHDPNSRRKTALEAAALGPYALPYEAGALISDAWQPGHTVTQDITQAAKGVSQLLPLPEINAPGDLLAMFLPKVIADTAEGLDYPNQRKTTRDVFDPLAARIPGLREGLPYTPPTHAR